MNKTCPLCTSELNIDFYSHKNKNYYQCNECKLIYMEPSSRLSEENEKAEYDLHENTPADEGYVKFLSKLINPLTEYINPQSKGLDFGCGPGPTLSKLLNEKGHKVEIYDPYYNSDKSVLENKYDFITATEVFEHLYHPDEVIPMLLNLLDSNGILGVMTKLSTGIDDFPNWHYKNDPTHVCFYSQETFNWIAEKYSLEVQFFGKDVIILTKR